MPDNTQNGTTQRDDCVRRKYPSLRCPLTNGSGRSSERTSRPASRFESLSLRPAFESGEVPIRETGPSCLARIRGRRVSWLSPACGRGPITPPHAAQIRARQLCSLVSRQCGAECGPGICPASVSWTWPSSSDSLSSRSRPADRRCLIWRVFCQGVACEFLAVGVVGSGTVRPTNLACAFAWKHAPDAPATHARRSRTRSRTPLLLSQKARVRTCPTLTRSSLALPPNLERPAAAGRTIALTVPPARSA
jgi:hypothetical protein